MPHLSRRSLIQSAAAVGASFAAPSILAAQSTIRDTDYVRMALEAIHPGLYRYQTPGEFVLRHKAFAKDYASADFDGKVLALQKLLCAVRCGHTFVNPANQTKDVRARLYGARRALPFVFRWIGDSMVLTKSAYDVPLPAGTRIESIDGRPVEQIIAALLPYARADGGNDGKRRALMSVGGTYQWPMFDLYYDLAFKPGASVAVEAVDPNGYRSRLRLQTIARDVRLSVGDKVAEPDPAAPIWFASRGNEERTKIITMPTWAIYKTKWNWIGWLQDQLKEMISDGTTGLVFDLRGNEGGQSIGEGMLPYFIRQPISFPRPQELVRFREAPENLRPIFNTWDKNFYSIGKEGESVEGGFIQINPAKEQTLEPMEQTFKGKVAVLINADNSSATYLFAEQLRAAGVATLIGETTGGNQRGINGGAYFFTRLPESGIEFDIPLIGYYPKGKKPDAGLEPDETVIQTAADIASGRDPVMDRALEVVA